MMKFSLFLELSAYDSKEYAYDVKGFQDTDAKWNLSIEYLQRLRKMEGAEYGTKKYFTPQKQTRKYPKEVLKLFSPPGDVTDEYLHEYFQ